MRYAFIPSLAVLVICLCVATNSKSTAAKTIDDSKINERKQVQHLESSAFDMGASTAPIKPAAAKTFHKKNVDEFVKMTGFGLERTKPMTLKHTISAEPAVAGKIDTYVMKKRELIGLMVNPKPVVYDDLILKDAMNPRRKEKLPVQSTRELSALETAALSTLREGQDIVIREEPGAVRIVGSIRAQKDCMGCHDCKEGDLLGAFTYRMEHSSKELFGHVSK